MTTNKEMIAKKSLESDAISDQVAEFLSKGGKVTQMEECTADDAIERYKKPYTVNCKDGTKRLYRRAGFRYDLNKLVPKTYGGHRSK